MTQRARQVQLVEYPVGEVTPAHFVTVEVEVPEPQPGQVLVRNTFTSVDPGMRLRLRESGPAGYFNSFPLNAAMDDIWAVGEVIESRADGFEAGDAVWHAKGWRDYAIVTAGEPALAGIATLARIDTSVAPAEKYLGPLGAMGVTAYAGIIDAAELREGDIVWVSAAAGAVGSLAAQIAKLRGHRVIGSAGSEEKVRYLLDELGLDAAFNYRDRPVVDRLREAAPDGIDVYFDNVGGDHLEAALATLRPWGRAALCGAISEYESVGPTPGPEQPVPGHGEQPHTAGISRQRLPAPSARRGARARRLAGRGPAALPRDDHRRPGSRARGAHAGAVRGHHRQGARAGRLGARRAARASPDPPIRPLCARRVACAWPAAKPAARNRRRPGNAPRRTRGCRPATGHRPAGTNARRSCTTRESRG